ncbi:MAG: N-acetyl-gamma-glutamyl-phosphate reductase [Sphaerochaetaceae bacterium]|nr:N-acetyl-gamma-glutamyl-phosphate reductase [Sphaerochaetaceae bacterium]
MKKIFIDGREGTTGLRIFERLGQREDIKVLVLDEDKRKDPKYRKEMLNESDISFLCLPDAAAIEAVSFVENPNTIIIDASTAHRTEASWAYGFPELSVAQRTKIINSKRIAVPGCHASGFIALVHPLIAAGMLSSDIRLTCHSITGYSGGGKKMIGQYEDQNRESFLSAPRQYGLNQNHKHLKEMKAISKLEEAPIFCPIVSDFYSGMVVTVPLFAKDLKGSVEDVKKLYEQTYSGKVVRYSEKPDSDGLLGAMGLSQKDSMEISVFGNEDRILLTARYDNLGKGASGAAVQCLNLVLGVDETTGLNI